MQSLLIPSSNSGKWVLSPDGSKLYVAGTDGNVRVYDSNDGSLLQTFEVGDYLNGIAISPDGTTLALSEGIPLPNNNVGFPRVYVVAEVYTLDLASGDVTSFVFESKYIQSYVFADVEFTANDTLRIIQQSIADTSSVYVPVITIDLSTGDFKESGIYDTADDIPTNIISNGDGTFIVFGASPGQYRYYVLDADGAEIAGMDTYQSPYIGSQGVEAYSGSSPNDKIAIADDESLFLYSSKFQFIADLGQSFPSLSGTPG